MADISHKALFDKLRDTSVLDRANTYAHWTLPQLTAAINQIGAGQNQVVERDYQEMGALLVNNLATKLAGILFPSTYPFFRIAATQELKDVAAQEGIAESEFNSTLARLEMESSQRLFMNASYAQLILALKHLIVTGNVLLYRDSTNAKCVAYGMQSFGIRRDGKGALLDCVLREFTYVEALSEEIKGILQTKDKAQYSRPEKEVAIYTRIKRSVFKGIAGYTVTQQVDTTPVGEPSWYPVHMCPWIAPTWSIIPGEHYGRGMVEDYAGGFAKLSDMSEAHALYSIEIMKVIHLVGLGGGADIDDLQAAETGEYIRGDAENVKVHESGDSMKLEQAAVEIERIFLRLAKAFMYQATTRNAERVTAYELQRDAREAEQTLGGTYSALSDGFQVPLSHVLIIEASPATLPGIATGKLKLNITAGIPALGRSSDTQNVLLAAQEIAAVAPVAQLDPRISVSKLVDMILAGRSVDPAMLFKSKQEMADEKAANAQIMQGQQQLLQANTAAATGQQLDALTKGL